MTPKERNDWAVEGLTKQCDELDRAIKALTKQRDDITEALYWNARFLAPKDASC